jgi:hypothetical protein
MPDSEEQFYGFLATLFPASSQAKTNAQSNVSFAVLRWSKFCSKQLTFIVLTKIKGWSCW